MAKKKHSKKDSKKKKRHAGIEAASESSTLKAVEKHGRSHEKAGAKQRLSEAQRKAAKQAARKAIGTKATKDYAAASVRAGHLSSEKMRAQSSHKSKRDYSYTQNREVSWLRFDDRVLTEALTPEVPLFERLKFCAIFQSNLDEWFMIRVGGLSTMEYVKNPPRDNKSDMTPREQLEVLFDMIPNYLGRQQEAFHAIERQLMRFGLTRVDTANFDDRDNVAVGRYFDRAVAPVLSPLVVDPRHPFPNLRNGQLYVMCALDAGAEGELLGMVEVPPNAPRVVPLPSDSNNFRYTLIEDVIAQGLSHSDLFNNYVPAKTCVVRVTRNADIDPDGEGVEEEEDYRQHMKKILRRRMRLDPVRVELQGSLGEHLEEFVREELGLSPERVSRLDIPLDLSYVYGLEGKLPARHRSALLFEPFEPQQSAMVDPARPVREQIMDHDVLLYYPYESMKPLLDLVRQAAIDDDCISIRITLYRVATRSRLCESLITAAENGKEVTVLMELRARFDEKNNIEWAERLSQAGCTVIYGSEGYKCHSKICQIAYHDKDGISRITCLGTGNFNEKTARLYSDFMLMTAHKGIGEDGNAFFRNLTLGNLHGAYKYLGVAPVGLKPLIMRGIDREISRVKAGSPSRIFMKMNSLTDRDVIDKIAEATQAGVSVTLIVRGICCIRPAIPGKSQGLEVRQIVGRLLEHSRVYAFGENVDTLYLSSADMMTRNTERRVEIAYPVLDDTCRELVIEYMDLQLSDNVKARRLSPEGTWEAIPVEPDEPLVNSQEVLIALAYHHAQLKQAPGGAPAPLSPELASLPPDVIRRLISIFSDYPLKLEPEVTPVAAPTQADDLHDLETAGDFVPPEIFESHPVAIPDRPADERPRDIAQDQAAVTAAAQAQKPAAPSTPQPVAAAKTPAPVPQATETPSPAEKPAPQKAPSTPGIPESPVTANVVDDDALQSRPDAFIVKRAPGRIATAFSLISLGLRTLIAGPEAALAAQSKADERNAKEERRRAERRARRSQKGSKPSQNSGDQA